MLTISRYFVLTRLGAPRSSAYIGLDENCTRLSVDARDVSRSMHDIQTEISAIQAKLGMGEEASLNGTPHTLKCKGALQSLFPVLSILSLSLLGHSLVTLLLRLLLGGCLLSFTFRDFHRAPRACVGTCGP